MTIIPLNNESVDSEYKQYYDQTGGMVPIFAGAQYQKGHGLGNIFSGLLKSALPILKKGAITLGETALSTGLNIAKDKFNGKSLKQAFKDNAKLSGQDILQRAVKHVTAKKQTKPNKKRKRTSNHITRRRTTRVKRAKHNDIFSG